METTPLLRHVVLWDLSPAIEWFRFPRFDFPKQKLKFQLAENKVICSNMRSGERIIIYRTTITPLQSLRIPCYQSPGQVSTGMSVNRQKSRQSFRPDREANVIVSACTEVPLSWLMQIRFECVDPGFIVYIRTLHNTLAKKGPGLEFKS